MPSSYVTPVTESPADERVSLISVINFVLRNIALILAVGLLVAIALAIRASMAPLTYTSTTSFMTEGEMPGRTIAVMGITLPGGSSRSPEFYIELMKSPAILGPLVESRFEAEAGQPPQTLIERYGGSGSPQAAKEAAMGKVLGSHAAKSSLNGVLTLRVTAEHPRLAAAIAQGFQDQIQQFNNNKRRLQTSAERQFAAQRLVEIEADVRAAEDRMRSFLERNRTITQSPALTIERDRLSDELSTRRALYLSVLQGYERAKMDEVRDSPQATIIASPTPPLGPDPRSTVRNAVLGFFLGAFLAVFLALTKEYFQRIPRESSPQAREFATLWARAVGRVRRPIHALLSAFRRPRHSTDP